MARPHVKARYVGGHGQFCAVQKTNEKRFDTERWDAGKCILVPMEVKTAVIVRYGEPLELWDVPVPELAPGGVLVRVEASTLCGTDAHRWLGHMAEMERPNGELPFVGVTSLPFVPGHESCGTIVDLRGEIFDVEKRRLQVGDRVIGAYPHCGHCYYCTISRQPTLCHENLSFGHHAPDRLLGGCAEFQYYPPGTSLISVPERVAPEVASSASCALRTVMHGFEQLGTIAPHESVLVLGAGPLGLYSVAVALAAGASKVLVVGAPAKRLAVASTWGADATLDLDTVSELDDRIEWVKQETSGRGADIVLQCASSLAFVDALHMARPGGRVVSMGISGGPPLPIPPILLFRQVRVSTVVMAEARHFLQAIRFIDRHADEYSFDEMVSGRYSLVTVTDAIRGMATFQEVKPAILPASN